MPDGLLEWTEGQRCQDDADEYLTVTEAGRVLWAGWDWGGDGRPAPGSARDALAGRWEQAADARQADSTRLMAEGNPAGAATSLIEAGTLRDCAAQLRQLQWEGQEPGT